MSGSTAIVVPPAATVSGTYRVGEHRSWNLRLVPVAPWPSESSTALLLTATSIPRMAPPAPPVDRIAALEVDDSRAGEVAIDVGRIGRVEVDP